MIAFDARAAKALTAGNHLTFDLAPGRCLLATASTRTWLQCYKSPVDDRMRQVRLGHWPAMSPTAALVAWQRARKARASGADVALRRRNDKKDERDRVEQARKAKALGACAVRRLADDYLPSYRGTVTDKTYTELERLFTRELSAIAALPAYKRTRTDAFELIDAMRDRPVVGKRMRQGLGAAWDHALDAGRLPANSPNGWRLVLRGKLPSRGDVVAVDGVPRSRNRRAGAARDRD